jgi:polysaccharide biosynthesis/export protein
MLRLTNLLASIALLGFLACQSAPGQTPTAAQMELIRQLPPEQQQQVLQRIRDQGSRAQTDAPRDRQQKPAQRDMREEERLREKPAQILDPVTGLALFGYDLFTQAEATFAPVTDMPVPVDYVLGPGDELHVQLLGRTPGTYVLVVNRDGAVNFPDLGPITVTGLGFDEARRMLQERVSQQMIGVTASITMGELRSIRVFVLGDAERPGSISVGSLSTITNALFASGGIKPIGSLRNIQLKRNGVTVATLDLYDLLMRGDTRADARLAPGDVIFIPPVGAQAGIDGEVRRPGVYELRGETTAADLLQLAGGLAAVAFPQGASLARINENRQRTIEDVDPTSAAGRAHRLRSGDLLTVPSVLERVDNAVTLSGHVYRPATVQYRPGMRLTDLLPSLDALKPLADTHYVLVRRELPPDRRIVALSADLAKALRAKGSEADIELQPGDKLTVFSLLQLDPEVEAQRAARLAQDSELALWDSPSSSRAGQGPIGENQLRRHDSLPLMLDMQDALRDGEYSFRDGQPYLSDEQLEKIAREATDQRSRQLESDRRTVVDKLLDELRLQATHENYAPVIRIGGRVRAEGLYPLEPGMRVSDLLRAGGRLAESAYVLDAEVTRYAVIGGEYRQAELVEVNLAAIRAGDPEADLLLQPYDFLNVKEVSDWSDQESVTLMGEVRFPGTYPIRKGETLLSVIDRAGGLTSWAYPDGAVFTRESLKERERQQIARLTQQMQADLAALALPGAQVPDGSSPAEAMAAGRAMLEELRSAEPVGRLAMDLSRVLRAAPGSRDDPQLQNGDVLAVPGPMQSVTVIGEVHSSTSHLYDNTLGRDDYVMLSGGFTQRADRKRVYVIKANGQVTAASSSRWFRASDLQVAPGDTIVVPMDVERMRPLPLWSAVTTIIYNMAVAVAAVNSF